MTNTARSIGFLLAFSFLACTPSCKTGSPPDGGAPTPPLTTVLVDCAKTIVGPVAGGEIPKIVTALTSDDVGGGMQAVIADLTNAGFLTTEAFAFAACVARNELGRSMRDAQFGDAAALKRANGAQRWIAANGVVFATAGPAPAARAGAPAGAN